GPSPCARGLAGEARRGAPPGHGRGALPEAVGRARRPRRDAGADVSAARLSHHALAAARGGADPQPAWQAALDAAHEAAASLGHAEAATHYAEALEALALGAHAPGRQRRAPQRGPAPAPLA